MRTIALIAAALLPLTAWTQPAPPAPGAIRTGPPGGPPANIHPLPTPPVSAEMPEKEKLSYVIGMFFGNKVTNVVINEKLEVDPAAIKSAFADTIDGKPTKYSQKEVSETLAQLSAAMQARKRKLDEEAKAKGEAFLTNFAKEPGVIVMTNGVEYKVITNGTGDAPVGNDTEVMAYRGTLIDGTEFDQNDNFTVMPGRVIKGWQAVLPLMKTGSKWHVVIPPAMAYGPRGSGKVPANAVLIFDMEVKSVTHVAAPLPPIVPATSAPGPKPTAISVPPSVPMPPSAATVSGQIIKVPSQEEMKKGAQIEVITNVPKTP